MLFCLGCDLSENGLFLCNSSNSLLNLLVLCQVSVPNLYPFTRRDFSFLNLVDQPRMRNRSQPLHTALLKMLCFSFLPCTSVTNAGPRGLGLRGSSEISVSFCDITKSHCLGVQAMGWRCIAGVKKQNQQN